MTSITHRHTNRTAEAALIATIAQDPTLARRLHEAPEPLQPVHFSDPTFSTLYRLSLEGQPVPPQPGAPASDPFTVADGVIRLAVMRSVETELEPLHHLIRPYLAGEIERDELLQPVDQARAILLAQPVAAPVAVPELSDLLATTLDAIAVRYAHRKATGSPIIGAPSGFPSLDNVTYGFQAGTLTLIGAPPAFGKTTLTVQMAKHAAREGHPVLYISFENSPQSIISKMLSSQSHRTIADIDGGLVDPADLREAASDLLAVTGGRLHIAVGSSTTDATTIRNMLAAVRKLHPDAPVPVLFLDYLQLLADVEARAGEDRRLAVSKTSARLRDVAVEQGVAVVAITSVNRASYQDGTFSGDMTSLKESGDLEFNADLVMLLASPEEKEKEEMERMGYQIGLDPFRLRLVKNRHGALASVPLLFHKAQQRFTEQGTERPRVPVGQFQPTGNGTAAWRANGR